MNTGLQDDGSLPHQSVGSVTEVDPPPPRLCCTGITVRFGGLVAVNDVDVAVPPATTVGLIGPNGAGKSTLFGVLSGLLRPSRGRVHIDGVDVTRERPQVRSVRGLARTFQHPELFGGLAVRDHLVLAYRAKHMRSRTWSDLFTMGSLRPSAEAEDEMIDRLLTELGLQEVADVPAFGLPLGIGRLVELGRALAASPTVLLLDEPSSGLDSRETDQLAEVLGSVTREHGVSVLLVEHDVGLVMSLCSQIYVLDFGDLIASGSPQEIQADPNVRAAYLGGDTFTEKSAEANRDPDRLLGHTIDRTEPTAPLTQSDVRALVVDNLSVRYAEATALRDISFAVRTGETLAVVGTNGAGKSSLARALSGLVRACQGKVTLYDQEIQSWSPDRIRRAGLVHLPEGRGIFRSLTVAENLLMAVDTLKGRNARRESLERASEFFPILGKRLSQRAGLLSGGEQQMLSLSRALVTFPKVLIADELSLGLAPIVLDTIFEGLARAQREGVTIILIEQYVHRALAFADQCLVLQRGGVTWNGPADAASEEILRGYLGDAASA